VDARLLARPHAVQAVEKLIEIMRDEDATHMAEIIAANSLLDRGWGRPPDRLRSMRPMRPQVGV
jgi:hypothetical protein